MEREQQQSAGVFGIQQHAALFGFFAHSAEAGGGQRGRQAVEQAVCRYGNQRGVRMARRAQRDGAPLDMRSFLLYSEWEDTEGHSEQRTLQTSPCLATEVCRCGWYTTWRELGLTAYAPLYCAHIDESVLAGFSSALALKMPANMAQGDAGCRFYWQGYAPNEAALQALFAERAARRDTIVRDFDYHAAHLYATLSDTLHDTLPAQAPAIEAVARADFARTFGDAAVDRVRAVVMNTDFAAI